MGIKFITGNRHKFREAKQILGNITRVELDLPEIQSSDVYEVVKKKLVEASKHETPGFMVTDMSLSLDCLNGLPGPLIKWFMKSIGSEGLYEISRALGKNGAEAKNVIGFTDEGGKLHFFEGSIAGRIVAPRGEYGFAWDNIFEPVGESKTFAEMTPEEKNEMSMFRMALDDFKSFLDSR